MLLKILAKVDGNFIIKSNIEIKLRPYLIRIFYNEDKLEYYISVQKEMYDFLDHLPKMVKGLNGELTIILPSEEFFEDIIQIMQHVESFGSIDVGISKINWESPTITWIPEKGDEEGLTPVLTYNRALNYDSNARLLTEDWLFSTIVHRRQLNELYIPFSFFREGTNLYHQHRYQSSFCTFYMMLEYFFHDSRKGYGINNKSYLNHTALNTALENAILNILKAPVHFNWIERELKKSNKALNPEGIVFLLNKFRDNFSHAAKKDKNRNILREKDFSSLAFLSMTICMFVSIKMRLLPPFVREQEKEDFLKR